MSNPTTFNDVCLAGQLGRGNNSLNSRIRTYEVPITVVASTSAQDTGIKIPNNVQAISASINVKTPESTGLTKTVSVGYVGAAASFLSAEDVSSAGNIGTPVTTAVTPAGATIAYTLGSADFVELEATAVITLIGWD